MVDNGLALLRERSKGCRIYMKTRNKELDIAKGIAAWLVIWGHTIQYCYAGDTGFYENIVFRFIYGFHMPFFMIISGYLFWKSCRKSDLEGIIKKQFIHIVYPLFVWNGIDGICMLLYKRMEIQSFEDVFRLVYASLKGLWFLWSIFIISVLIAIIYFSISNKTKRFIGYIASFAILMILPEKMEPCKTMNIWMYPYFLAGFLWAEIKEGPFKEKIKKCNLKYGAIILYPLLIQFFHVKDYIYTSGITLFDSEYGFAEQIRIDIYRWIVGYAGILFMIVILHELLQNEKIKRILYMLFGELGQITLQVYVMQRLLLEEIFGGIYKVFVKYRGGQNPLLQNIELYNFLWTPIIGILHLLIIYKMIMLISRNHKLNRWLFGLDHFG